MRPLIGVVFGLSLAAGAKGQGVTVRGLVYDSLHSHPLSGAVVAIGAKMATTDSAGRFAIADVAPGSYRVTAQHDVIDRLGISAIGTQASVTDGSDYVRLAVPSFKAMWRFVCGERAPPSDTGFVFGSLRSSVERRNAKVSASWIDIAANGTTISQKVRTVEVNADSLGDFALCGVPTASGLTIRATADSLESGSFDIGPLDRERVIRRDLTLGAQIAEAIAAGRGASVSGRVLSDSGRNPIANVELTLTDLGVTTTTNERGEYVFKDLAPGTHRLHARKIGYGDLKEIAFDVEEAEQLGTDIVLSKITLLDSVQVKAKPLARDEQMRVFEEHRKIGLGKFITAEELEKHRALPLTSLIRQWPGVYIPANPDPAGRDPVSKRGIKSIANRTGPCKIALYLDGVRLGIPFDEVPPETLAGLEYYPSPATTPIEYMHLNNNCGVIIMHSRYKTGK